MIKHFLNIIKSLAGKMVKTRNFLAKEKALDAVKKIT
jgi:hypothetical protein